MAANENIITVPQNELRQFLKGVEVFDRAEMVRKGREMDQTTVKTTPGENYLSDPAAKKNKSRCKGDVSVQW